MNRNTTWNENNLLSRVKEAEEKEYLEELKELINGEIVAATQYLIASQAVTGEDQDYLRTEFNAHVSEELDHFRKLTTCLMERGGMPEPNLSRVIDNAQPATMELENLTSEELRKFFVIAEQDAVIAYQKFYDRVENQDKDLAQIVLDIIAEERDHKLDFTRMIASVEEPLSQAVLPDETSEPKGSEFSLESSETEEPTVATEELAEPAEEENSSAEM